MNSSTAYLCIQGWGNDEVGVAVTNPTAGASVDDTLNPGGMTTNDLADFTTFFMNSAADDLTFTTNISMTPDSADYDGMVTIALLGVAVYPSAIDTVVRAELVVGSETYNTAAAVYGQEMSRAIAVGTEGHELIGGGLTNIVFHDLPASVIGSDCQFTLTFENGFSIAGSRVRVGSVFVGLQIPLKINPSSFTWSEEIVNSQFESRSGSNISSDGFVRRMASLEAQLFNVDTITGINSSFYSGTAPMPNLFRAAIANVGQPMLLSPYPYPVSNTAWNDSAPDSQEIEERLLAVRQNFFSIYGLMDRRMDVTIDTYNAGLNSLYKSRIRFSEIR